MTDVESPVEFLTPTWIPGASPEGPDPSSSDDVDPAPPSWFQTLGALGLGLLAVIGFGLATATDGSPKLASLALDRTEFRTVETTRSPLQGPLLDRSLSEMGGPTSFNVLLTTPEGTLLVDPVTQTAEVRQSSSYLVQVATPGFVLGSNASGLAQLHPFDQSVPEMPVSSEDSPEFSAELFGSALVDFDAADAKVQYLEASDPNELWQVLTFEDESILFRHDALTGMVLAQFRAPKLDWDFRGGNPIGNDGDGRLFELNVSEGGAPALVSDGRIIASHPDRVLVLDCVSGCRYRWLDRETWRVLDLPTPTQISVDWQLAADGRWLVSDEGTGTSLVDLGSGRTVSVSHDSPLPSFVSPDGQWLVVDEANTFVAVNLSTLRSFRVEMDRGTTLLALIPRVSGPQARADDDEETQAAAQHLGQLKNQIATDVAADMSDSGLILVLADASGNAALLNAQERSVSPISGVTQPLYVDSERVLGHNQDGHLASVEVSSNSGRVQVLASSSLPSILEGPEADQLWVATRQPNEPASYLQLHGFDLDPIGPRIEYAEFSWFGSGVEPYGGDQDSIVQKQGLGYAYLRSGLFVAASGDVALLWECPSDQEANGDPPKQSCTMVLRSLSTWAELDRHLPSNFVGVGGLFAEGEWLLAFVGSGDDAPSVWALLNTVTGSRINVESLASISVDRSGRWLTAIDGGELVLMDLHQLDTDSDEFLEAVVHRSRLPKGSWSVRLGPGFVSN